MNRLKLFLPLILFAALTGLFWVMQQRIQSGDYDPQALPAARLNQSLPELSLPDLRTGEARAQEHRRGRAAPTHVWATRGPASHSAPPWVTELPEPGAVAAGVGQQAAPVQP